MSKQSNLQREQPNNPLHGITLKTILLTLLAQYGWGKLALKININCFKSDPSINSSLTFLRRTPWAKEKVIELYLDTQNKIKRTL
ncbi:MAG: VF530 family DNA-binding protein [Flavobacteriales bacterium]|jgi:uncharacterized protein (DUF2132 family)|nr:VF530 family protein [Flavobacteriaceae bacterium]|tara:strand:- start:32 stop:286 length:255 start_codon:yes stop_codon:yes gene_type:complete